MTVITTTTTSRHLLNTYYLPAASLSILFYISEVDIIMLTLQVEIW